MESFRLSGDYIELSKLLKATGLCQTGGMAKIAIQEGQVRVDGAVEHRKRRKIRNRQRVEYNGRTIEVKQV